MIFDPNRPFGAPFVPPMPSPDPFEAKAVEIVKEWLRSMMQGIVMIDEHDTPNVHMNPPTCANLAARIADGLREAARGGLG